RSLYKLHLPQKMTIHNVFHVSLLEPTHPCNILGRHIEPPPTVTIDGEEEYEVEEILDSRKYKRSGQYLVKWLGYNVSEATWESTKDVTHCQDALSKFHRDNPTKPGPWNIGARSSP